MSWHALRAARAHDASLRVPVRVGTSVVGSVACAHLERLRAWPEVLGVDARGVQLLAPASERDGQLAAIHRTLHAEGLIHGWRDELYALTDLQTGQRLALIERAASRFWGSLTLGAHANGYVADEAGRPTHLWIAQRSMNKATDPGLYDNLVGGGVPSHQTPLQALIREGYEEAGLDEMTMQRARPGRVMHLLRDIPEGLQREDLHAHDLLLPAGLQPVNQDGEVQGFQCLPVDDALALAAGHTMTVDAALVTLDFALRHSLLPSDEAARLGAGLQTVVRAG